MKRALITTTIHDPENLEDWARGLRPDDLIIVVGDQKSPHFIIADRLRVVTDHTGVPGVYLHPDDQTKWQVSQLIGWNSIQRRNIGILEAIAHGADWVTTIDDDNYPTTLNWARETEDIFTGADDQLNPILIDDETGWFNIGLACSPAVTHRGFPLEMRHVDSYHTVKVINEEPLPIGVVASLVIGDPDIDAVERIVNAPEVRHVYNQAVILGRGTWCPFNSQATSIRGELLPLYFLFPHIGRYDDIWASYVMRAWMDQNNWYTQYGAPLVRQDRNPHNLVSDLEAEIFGMRHTTDFTSRLRALDLAQRSPWHALRDVNNLMVDLHYVPQQTLHAMHKWAIDVATAQQLAEEAK